MTVDVRKFKWTRDRLLAYIEDFLDETGMSYTRFGMIVTNSPNLVSKLREGKDVTTNTYDRCIRAMDVWRARQMKVKQRKKYGSQQKA